MNSLNGLVSLYALAMCAAAARGSAEQELPIQTSIHFHSAVVVVIVFVAWPRLQLNSAARNSATELD